MARLRFIRFLSIFILGLVFLAGCGAPESSRPIGSAVSSVYTVTMLIEKNGDEHQWFRDVQVPKGYDAYQLSELVLGEEIESDWFAAYQSHFVKSIMGKANHGNRAWILYLWDDFDQAWEPLPVGADWFSLKEGHILAWSYGDTSAFKVPKNNP